MTHLKAAINLYQEVTGKPPSAELVSKWIKRLGGFALMQKREG